MKPRLTHQDEHGRARMVDVGEKPATRREATAEGRLLMSPSTFDALLAGRTPKGDPLLVARIAGIQAAKSTAALIPLCHPVPLDDIDVDLRADESIPGIHALATARVTARTGIEMEALTAVSIALLTAYDMLKGIERAMRIDGIRLLRKSGGRSGDWAAETQVSSPPA